MWRGGTSLVSAVSASVIIGLLGVILGPLVAYFGIARRASGKIGTSEATQLWEESRSIRDWASRRISELEAKIERLEQEHEDCLQENLKLQRRVRELEAA